MFPPPVGVHRPLALSLSLSERLGAQKHENEIVSTPAQRVPYLPLVKSGVTMHALARAAFVRHEGRAMPRRARKGVEADVAC